MRVKNKKIIVLLSLAGCMLLSYWFWLSLRPVKIVAVHQEDNFSEVLVKNFPITDQGKLNWWVDNQKMLKTKYNIPKASSYGNFYINFWDFGDGYKEQGKYDRRCFLDMKAAKNCIDKKAVFSVENDRRGGVLLTVYDGVYRMQENGGIIKIK